LDNAPAPRDERAFLRGDASGRIYPHGAEHASRNASASLGISARRLRPASTLQKKDPAGVATRGGVSLRTHRQRSPVQGVERQLTCKRNHLSARPPTHRRNLPRAAIGQSTDGARGEITRAQPFSTAPWVTIAPRAPGEAAGAFPAQESGFVSAPKTLYRPIVPRGRFVSASPCNH
jgi:hypothetical protein